MPSLASPFAVATDPDIGTRSIASRDTAAHITHKTETKRINL
jgi:hypothetical protein